MKPMYGEGSQDWIYASNTPKVLGIDLRALFPLIFVGFFRSLTALFICLFVVAFFAVVGKFGYDIRIFMNLVRHRLRGSEIESFGYIYTRKYQHSKRDLT